MAADKAEEYTVRWTGLVSIDGRYEIIGPVEEPIMFSVLGRLAGDPRPWRKYTWTLWGAKRAIRNHKRSREIIYRESA
jgi:hypothetical protein